MKKLFALLLALVMVFALAACGGGDATPADSGKPADSQQGQTADKPDTSKPQTEATKTPEETAAALASGFGSYNGQSIVWRVLDIDLVNERALLISSDCIDEVLFHETEPTEELTWETSDLRKWLGGEFYETAFTAEQRAKILTVTNPADTNSESGAQGGNDTTDTVFILSASEMKKYFADDADMAGFLNGEDISYWTRTPGDSTQGYVCTYGDSDGGLYMTGNWATSTEVAVRPAIWVNLSDEAATAAAAADFTVK